MKMLRGAVLFGALIAAAAANVGCATSGGGTGAPGAVYTIGQGVSAVLSFAGTFGKFHAIPAKVCGPLKAVADAYVGLEAVASDPAAADGIGAAALAHLGELATAAIAAAADIGFSMLAPKPHLAALTKGDWDAQLRSIEAGRASLNC